MKRKCKHCGTYFDDITGKVFSKNSKELSSEKSNILQSNMVQNKDDLSATKKLMIKVSAGEATKEEKDLLRKIQESLKERSPEQAKELEKFGKEIGKGIAEGMQGVTKTKTTGESSYKKPISEEKSQVKKPDSSQTKQGVLSTSVQPIQPTKQGEKEKKKEFEYSKPFLDLQAKLDKGDYGPDEAKELRENYESMKSLEEDRKQRWEEKEKEEKESKFLGSEKLGKAKSKFWGGVDKAVEKKEKIQVGWEKMKSLPIVGGAIGGMPQKIMSPLESSFWSGVFGVALFILFYITMAPWGVISIAEGYAGMPLKPSWMDLYITPFFTRQWYFLPVLLAIITTPLSLVGGITKTDFKGASKGLFWIAALECSIILFNNIGLGWAQAVFPEQTAFFKCMIKYSGSIQLCALNQTEEIQVEKMGSYEVLNLDLGAVTPSRTFPPMNPYPYRTNSGLASYYFTFTLKNSNRVGSPYEINVSDIKVTASHEDGTDNHTALEYPYYPTKPISPGGYFITQAKFTQTVGLPECSDEEPYTYFHINLTTNQSAGGSAKFGIIESDEGMDNQNFMFFFDPAVNTQPGPVDVYVYMIPFVLPAKIIATEPFLTFIRIENKGSGTIESIDITLIYNPSISSITGDFSWYCSSSTCNTTFSPPGGSNGRYTFNSTGIINPGEIYTIYNVNGNLAQTNMVGKYTGLISVVANYRYKQQFDEQIACIKPSLSPSEMSLECTATSGNTWCPRCSGFRINQWGSDRCIAGTDCGYTCSVPDCGAGNCDPGDRWDQASCSCVPAARP